MNEALSGGHGKRGLLPSGRLMGQDDPCLLPKRKKRDHAEGGPVTPQLH